MRDDRPSSIRFYLGVIRRRWPVMLVVLIIPIAVAVVLTARATKQYQGRALVIVNRQSLSDEVTGTSNPAASSSDFLNILSTYADAAHSVQVADAVASAVPAAHLSGSGLLGDATVTASQDSDVLSFAVTNRDPRLALRLARTYANVFLASEDTLEVSVIDRALRQVDANLAAARAAGQAKLVATFSQRNDQLRSLRSLQTADDYVAFPTTTAAKTSPRTTLDIGLGVVVGVLLAILLAALLETLDTRVTGTDEIAETVGAPALGRFRASRGAGPASIVALATPSGDASEDYRSLRTNLQLQTLADDAHVILVTSAADSGATAEVVANLGALAARAGQNVILVDLNLRSPSLGTALSVDSDTGPGVTDVLLGHVGIEQALVAIPIPDDADANRPSAAGSLRLLRTGPLPPDPGDLISSDQMPAILAAARACSDMVYVDAPSAADFGDAVALSPLCDAVLLVVPSPKANRRALADVSRSFGRSPARVAGFAVRRSIRGA